LQHAFLTHFPCNVEQSGERPVPTTGGRGWWRSWLLPAAPVPSLCSASDTPSSGAWPGRGGGRSTAWRGGDGGRFSHRAGAWNLEAEGEAPATGSSGNCSRWGWLAAYLGGEYLLSAGTEASRGMGRSHGVRRSREFFYKRGGRSGVRCHVRRYRHPRLSISV